MKPCIHSFFVVLFVVASSCVYHDIEQPVDCNTVVFEIAVVDLVNASVCGAEDGSFGLQVTGGVAPYQFTLGDRGSQAASAFEGLSSGLYAVTIADQNGCTAVYDSVLISVENFFVDFATTEDTGCTEGSGTVTVTVNEHTGPYQYALDDGAFTDSNIFEDLTHGDHLMTIADAMGCGVRKTFTIPRGATGVSWSQNILPIFTRSCAINGCHNGTSRRNDWRIYAQVKENASDIRTRTQNKSMPFDSALPQGEIDLIACWIDEGAQDN